MVDESNEGEGMPLQDAVDTVLTDLPEPVRKFLTGPERDATVIRLVGKHNLHIDQAGEFEKALLHMLLGVITPEEFVTSLHAAGISEDVIQALLSDVNEQIFIPIRKAEQAATPTTVLPQAPLRPLLPPVFPVATTSPPAPIPIYVPTPLTPLAPPVANTPRPLPPVMPTAPSLPSMPPQFIPQQTPQIPSEEHLSMRTMASDMQAVKEHRVAEPLYTPPIPRVEMPVAPIVPPPSVPQPLPRSSVPFPQTPAAAVPTTPLPPTPRAAPPPANLPGASLIKEYSSDPYREPVE